MQKKVRRQLEPRELTEFGLWVKHRLVDKQMTAVELCRRVGISSEVYLSRILHGNTPGWKYIEKIQRELQEAPERRVG